MREDDPPLFMRDQQLIQDYEYGSESSEGRAEEDDPDRPPFRSQIRQMMRIIEKNDRAGGRPARGGYHAYRGRVNPYIRR